ncbi:hypothetical protein INT47_004364 [Mucor saturninus]|uniref:C2H2-type domain-containing protein n=1 Tax=Mucor saturninus TaxID=64648 RepID=A0A8H7QU18_9FUNG|nr:hypothetical protein INT47_004364 [Mucor saturninus]
MNGVNRKLPEGVVVIDCSNITEDLQYATEFACPGCYELFKNLDALDSHVTIEHGQGEDVTFNQDEAFTSFSRFSHISAEPVSTDTELIATVSLHQAIESLYPEHSNTDNLMITNIITIVVTALTTPSQHQRISDVNTRGIKRVKLDTSVETAVIQSTECIHLNKISKDIGFNEIIRKSTYHQLLAFEKYSFVTEEHLDLLNGHWRKRSFV